MAHDPDDLNDFAAPGAAGASGDATDVDASVAATLQRLPRTRQAILDGVRAGLHLGAQLYVSRHGTVIADAAAGDSRPGQPLRRDDLMLWLSSTKPVAAVAIAQLWERGRLELDDPVARHIPEFAANGKGAITLRHLLTHTAGIRLLNVGWPQDGWDAIIARIAAMRPEPRWVPGRKAGYHHASSWFLLGEVVRRLDGRPFSGYAREEIFAPLGMLDSWIGMPVETYRELREQGRICPLYDTAGSAGGAGGAPVPQGWDSEAWCTGTHPGGNGYGPISQLGRFYEMLLARGQIPGAGGAAARRILSPQAVEAATARHRAGMLDHTFQHVLDWGLGFILDSRQYGADTVPYGYGNHASPRTFGHSGYRSSTAFADPEQGLAVALAFNGTPTHEAHERRIRTVLDALYEDLGLVAAAEAVPAAPVVPMS
ncbi:MAG TPA: serine hydrolase domain-containing protein [Thermoanaerobaculia bacterium]|nr:serine hydrolase domain-containing protein [Thermoanaerobaculia bacterium]